MSIFKKFLSSWLLLVSTIGFLGGWALIARAFELRNKQDVPEVVATVVVELSAPPNLDELIANVQLKPGSVTTFVLSTPLAQAAQLTQAPSMQPTMPTAPQAANLPTAQPTLQPTALPTAQPIAMPTALPRVVLPTRAVVTSQPRFPTGAS